MCSQVADSEIEEIFSYPDADRDRRINWAEFQTMINPPQGPASRASRGQRVQSKGVRGKGVSFHPEKE